MAGCHVRAAASPAATSSAGQQPAAGVSRPAAEGGRGFVLACSMREGWCQQLAAEFIAVGLCWLGDAVCLHEHLHA